jgi:hypothetical protein
MEGKDIYMLLVLALLCRRRPMSPHLATPCCPARPVDDAQLATSCHANTGTRPIFQHIEQEEEPGQKSLGPFLSRPTNTKTVVSKVVQGPIRTLKNK